MLDVAIWKASFKTLNPKLTPLYERIVITVVSFQNSPLEPFMLIAQVPAAPAYRVSHIRHHRGEYNCGDVKGCPTCANPLAQTRTD